MIRRAWVLILAVLMAAPLLAQPVFGAPHGARLLIRFAPSLAPAERNKTILSIGGFADEEIPALGVTRVVLPLGAPLENATRRLADVAGVVWSEADSSVHLQLTPNDALYMTDPYTGAGQWSLRTAAVDRAWDIVRGSSSVTVAAIDTGVDANHPDLIGSLLPGLSFLTTTSRGCITQANDDSSHGTHVAGIIAAAGNNSIGIAGVAFGVKVLPLKALDCTGAGQSSDVAAAIVYAADHGARIINISLGSSVPSQTVLSAVQYARGKDVLIVAAAGNCGAANPDCSAPNEPSYPAAYPGVFAVGATMPDDSRAPFSTQASYVGIAAPGYRIVSTTPTYPTYLSAMGATTQYAAFSGTSAAAPLVTGVAALVLSKEPNLTVDQLTDRLRSTADDLGTPGIDTSFGSGRVNAYRAVTGGASPPVPSGTYGAIYDTSRVPRTAGFGAQFTAPVRLTNTSTFVWPASGAGAVRLGYRWLDGTGKTVVVDGIRTPLVSDVAVGGTTELNASVVAPPTLGSYLLRLDMVRDGVGFFSDQRVATGDVLVTVNSGYGVSYSPGVTSSVLILGSPVLLNVALTNTGSRVWPAGGPQPVHLSYHWLAVDGSVVLWNGARASFGQDVIPGGSVAVALPVVPPTTIGTFRLRIDVVEEGVTWFSAQGVPTSDLLFTVTNGLAASYSVITATPTLLPGGRVTLPVAIRNEGIATWPATGPSAVHAAVHLYDTRGNVVAWDGARSILASDVQPSESVSLALVVDAPLQAGLFRVEPDVVQEGVAWFSSFGSRATSTFIAVVPDYRATLPTGVLNVSRSSPVTTVTVTNSSSALWSASGRSPVMLSAHWLGPSGDVLIWDGPRTPLPREVAPGESVTVQVTLGPVPAGASAVVIDLVSEGLRWFEAGAPRPVTLLP